MSRHAAGTPGSIGGQFAHVERGDNEDLEAEAAEAEAAADRAYTDLLNRDGIHTGILEGPLGGSGRFRHRRWNVVFTSADGTRTYQETIRSADLEAIPTPGGVMRYLSGLARGGERREKLSAFLGESTSDYLD